MSPVDYTCEYLDLNSLMSENYVSLNFANTGSWD